METTEVSDDLAAEYAQLRAFLEGLDPKVWASASSAEGWSVTDVVPRLAQGEELVAATAAGDKDAFDRRPHGISLEAVMDILVEGERGTSHDQVFQRWSTAAVAWHYRTPRSRHRAPTPPKLLSDAVSQERIFQA